MHRIAFSVMALALLAACAQQQAQEPTREQLVARGEYLVNNIGGCNDCHTPMTPTGPDMTQALQGATLIFAPTVPMPWGAVAPSIAGIPAGYTEEQFAAFLQTGVKPDGSSPRPPMPAFRLNEDDAQAMAAYIATVPRETPQAP